MIALFQFYILGLGLSCVCCLLVSLIWVLFWLLLRRRGRLAKQWPAFQHELLLMNLLAIPILSFACAAIVIMLQA